MKQFTLLMIVAILIGTSFCNSHRFDELRAYEANKDEDALIRVLRVDKDNYIRSQAAQSLGRLKSKKAVPYLIEGLQSDDWVVRYYCAWALGKIGDPKGLESLEKQKKIEKDENVLKEILKAIQKINEAKSNNKKK